MSCALVMDMITVTPNRILEFVSFAILFFALTLQLGCTHQVVAPLSQTQFRTDYAYKIKTNQNFTLEYPAGTQIQNTPDRLLITENGQTKYLLHSQISEIEGVDSKASGVRSWQAGLIGLGGGAALGFLTGLITVASLEMGDGWECSDTGCANHSSSWENQTIGLSTGIGAAVGGLIGFIAGAATEHNKIQITPTITPTPTGVNTGANVQIHF